MVTLSGYVIKPKVVTILFFYPLFASSSASQFLFTLYSFYFNVSSINSSIRISLNIMWLKEL